MEISHNYHSWNCQAILLHLTLPKIMNEVLLSLYIECSSRQFRDCLSHSQTAACYILPLTYITQGFYWGLSFGIKPLWGGGGDRYPPIVLGGGISPLDMCTCPSLPFQGKEMNFPWKGKQIFRRKAKNSEFFIYKLTKIIKKKVF